MKILQIFSHKRSITMNEITISYLLFKKPKIKTSTYYRYQYIINKYILPEFGNYCIKSLEKYDFNIFVNNLSNTMSCKSTQDIVVILKSILRFAEAKYDFKFEIDLITIPKELKKEVDILSDKEQNSLSNSCLKNSSLKNIGIFICLNTGIRLGEICALQWKDIDLNSRTININKTVQRVYLGKNKTKVILDYPKTQNSIRKIPINTKTQNILIDLDKEYSFKNDDFFLTSSIKRYIEPRSYQKYFKKTLKKLNLGNHNFHILRHTFATNCIKNGMDTKSLSELLGHSNINITLNKYVHSSYEQKIKYLEKI